MGVKRDTYCSGKFLESFYDKIAEVKFIDSMEDRNLDWLKEFYRFLHGGCNLVLDLDDEEIIRRSDEKAVDYNPHFRRLWSEGRKRYISYPDTFDQMDIDDQYFESMTTELFLLSKNSSQCAEIECNSGLFCASEEMLEGSISKICNPKIQAIEKGNEIGWSFLFELRLPSNATVIVDNFILKDSATLNDNLYPILRAILPETCGVLYHLTILSKSNPNMNSVFKKVRNFLDETFKYQICLSIAPTDINISTIHDRNIITNYCWFRSGAGFNLFKQFKERIKSIHNTDINIWPAVYVASTSDQIGIEIGDNSTAQGSYSNLISLLKDYWIKVPTQVGNIPGLIGEKKNRLLD